MSRKVRGGHTKILLPILSTVLRLKSPALSDTAAYVPTVDNVKAAGKAAILGPPERTHKGACICVNAAHGQ